MRLDKRIEKTAKLAKYKKGIRFYCFKLNEYLFIENPKPLKKSKQ